MIGRCGGKLRSRISARGITAGVVKQNHLAVAFAERARWADQRNATTLRGSKAHHHPPLGAATLLDTYTLRMLRLPLRCPLLSLTS